MRLALVVAGWVLAILLGHTAQAQVVIPGTNLTVTSVNGGTGTLTSIAIPGGSGLAVTVGTGSAALPLQEIKNNPNAVNITTYDDSYNQVPLGFDFPFYGRVFNNSWAMTNGLVTFQDPNNSGLGGACCEGVDLRTTTDPRYNYTIYGMHTDLYSWNGQNQYYLREGNSMTYGWYNLSQCCSSQGGNSFEIKINSLGLVDTRIAGAMVSGNRVTSGMAGDLSKGEFYQYYHGSGLNIAAGGPSIFSWQALNGTGAVDMCYVNPLSSPTCPGYQTAYTTQQCTVSALWDPSCPGYQTAYFTQQCSLDSLYNSQCPGYQAAYLQQQCSVNPLYSTTCSGYQQAYHDQQCSVNTLAYSDCPGYAAAYLQQQCTANPLYSTTCPGYATAYKTQQCSLNALFATDCPGYAQEYLNQQCLLDSLYSRLCSGYETAYAIKYLITNIDSTAVNSSLSTTAATKANDPTSINTNGIVTTTAATTTLSSDGTVSTGVSSTGNTTIDTVIQSRTTSTTGNSPSAAVQLSPQANQQQNSPVGAIAVASRQEEKKTEDKKSNDTNSNSASTAPSSGNNSSDSKSSDQPKTARQELQERREGAAKAKAVEAGKQLANEMGKASNMENQVAVQNVVIQAMGYSPAFEAYKVRMPDVPGYKPYAIYSGQKTVDNRGLSRGLFGATDSLHNSMVEQQYK